MNHRLMTFSLGVLATALLACPANTQMRAGGGAGNISAGHAGSGFAASGRVGAFAGAGRNGANRGGFGRSRRAHRYYGGYYGYAPYYYPYYPYYDFDDSPLEPPPPPQRFVSQISTPIAPVENEKPADSLVMELRGDHWVRLTSFGPLDSAGQSVLPGTSAKSTVKAPPVEPHAKTSAALASSQPSVLLPAAKLVFHDGHQEDAARYTIVGSTIFIKSDYWTTGSWIRKVAISDLDIPATLKINQDLGTRFTLPSRPTEVIIHP